MRTHRPLADVVRTLLAEVTATADERTRIVAEDPVAAGMRAAVQRIEEGLAAHVAAVRELPIDAWREHHGLEVSEQAIRGWCRRGLVLSRRTPHGWMIVSSSLPPTLRTQRVAS